MNAAPDDRMKDRLSARTLAILLGAGALACAAGAAVLFPRAFPILSVDQRLTGPVAARKADSFALAHGLPRAGTRVASRFVADSRTQVFLDLSGGADTVRAVARGTDHALYRWQVRRFTPGDVHETNIALAPDGRVIGFRRTLADSEPRPALSADSAQALALRIRNDWLAESPARWKLATSSYDTKPGSHRIDRTFMFERTDLHYLGAALRLKIVIGGDLPVEATRSVDVPERFERQYTEMRASNAFYASLSGIGQVLLFLACVVALRRFSRDGGVRWRPAFIAGGVIGLLLAGAGINTLPSAWYGYDTATSATAFLLQAVAAVALGGLVTGVLVGVTLAAAEAATRRAFPLQLDWWRWWEARGTRQVAGRVLGGYAIAAFGLLYVCLFYLVTRRLLGWWTPSEMLDDPNQIATRLPWLGGLANSLQAGVWEEAMFRVLPLSLLALWARGRSDYRRVMALGVIGTALVFGFAHATYPSWPAYSRGVELFLESSLWAVVVLAFGPLPTMLGHFLFDFILFNLFAGAGTGPVYRLTAAVAVVLALVPAAAVAWKLLQQRGLTDAVPSQSLGAWVRGPGTPVAHAAAVQPTRRLTPRARAWAMVAGTAGLVITLAAPARESLGPRFTASRAMALHVADSALLARGVPVQGWTRLARVAADSMDALPRLLAREHADSLAQPLASSIHPAGWWVVRYVHPHGTLEQRVEEWRVRLWPDGRLMDVRHLLPDVAWRDSLSDDQARAVARRALAEAALDTLHFVEAKLVADLKAPGSSGARRKDVTITFTDTTHHLPGGALARAWVSVAGDDVMVVRRGIELPEAFLRDDRHQQEVRMMAGGGLVFAVLGLLLGGIIVARGRCASLLDDRPLGTRGLWTAIAVLVVLTVAGQLNQLPRTLASYDTAVPWRAFLLNDVLCGIIGLALLGLVAGLWLAWDGLRRRVGIPFVEHRPGAWPDTLSAG
ncbi:MAG: CPBP family glutamic-type intramembrane protease, partial [Gemmatimonadaceae bacterium]